MDFDKALNSIQNLRKGNKNLFIGIDGRSGSGKTSVANKIASHIANSKLIHLDDFDLYQGEIRYNEVLRKVIKPNLHTNKSTTFVLEGVFALNSILEDYYDYKIWVECPRDLGFARGLQRDIELNGIDNSEKWKTYWLPKEDEYISKENPQEKAHIILDGTK